MAEARSEGMRPGGRTGDARSDVDPDARHQPVEPRPVRSDDEATNRADWTDEPVRKPYGEKSPAEIERDIAHTRAEMSETIDAIEYRLSPEHLKQEMKHTVHETIDEVKDRFSPERLKYEIKNSARYAGRNMLDTIKENPVPSVIAGLSVGWLIMRAGQHASQDRYDRYYDRDYEYWRTGYYDREPRYSERRYAEPGYYRGEGPYVEVDYYEATYGPTTPDYGYATGYEGTDGGSMKERAGDKANELKHQASDKANELKHQAGEKAQHAKQQAQQTLHEAQERVQEFGHDVQYQARRASSQVEHMVYQNPLAAGAIAIGVGALLGSLLPSTRKENEMMGATRDRVVHKAEDVVHETVDKAEQVASRTAQEAKSAAKEVVQTAKESKSVSETMSTAKQEAQHVATSAKQGSQEVKNTAKEETKNATKSTS